MKKMLFLFSLICLSCFTKIAYPVASEILKKEDEIIYDNATGVRGMGGTEPAKIYKATEVVEGSEVEALSDSNSTTKSSNAPVNLSPSSTPNTTNSTMQ